MPDPTTAYRRTHATISYYMAKRRMALEDISFSTATYNFGALGNVQSKGGSERLIPHSETAHAEAAVAVTWALQSLPFWLPLRSEIEISLPTIFHLYLHFHGYTKKYLLQVLAPKLQEYVILVQVSFMHLHHPHSQIISHWLFPPP